VQQLSYSTSQPAANLFSATVADLTDTWSRSLGGTYLLAVALNYADSAIGVNVDFAD